MGLDLFLLIFFERGSPYTQVHARACKGHDQGQKPFGCGFRARSRRRERR